MLNGLGLEKFKAFKTRNDLSFKKLNVFLGPNSSGKSSYIKALTMLNETIKSPDEEPAIKLSEEIGDINSIIYGNKDNGRITFSLSFSPLLPSSEEAMLMEEARNHIFYAFLATSPNEKISKEDLEQNFKNFLKKYCESPIARVDFTLKQTQKRPNIVENILILLTDGRRFSIKMDRNHFYTYKGDEKFSQPNIFKPYKFLFRLDEKKIDQSKPEEIRDILLLALAFDHLEIQLKKFFENFSRIEPFRYRPERTEHISNFKYNTVDSDGGNTLSAVMGLSQRDDSNEGNERLKFWLQEFALGQGVEVDELRANLYSLVIKNKYTGIQSNIVDVGVGTSQLLPIVLATIISPSNSVLAIEEPETHIHPNAQAKLAELFVDAIDQKKQFFIETHSMYFVQQLQILIAEEKIKPEDVGIYYFHQDENGSHITDLEILPNGQFKQTFPSGFFDVAFDLSMRLMSAAQKKKE